MGVALPTKYLVRVGKGYLLLHNSPLYHLLRTSLRCHNFLARDYLCSCSVGVSSLALPRKGLVTPVILTRSSGMQLMQLPQNHGSAHRFCGNCLQKTANARVVLPVQA